MENDYKQYGTKDWLAGFRYYTDYEIPFKGSVIIKIILHTFFSFLADMI
jgi:hypothetical protein